MVNFKWVFTYESIRTSLNSNNLIERTNKEIRMRIKIIDKRSMR